MATQEENERDPAWLMKQRDRYKEEVAQVSRERDELKAVVGSLEKQIETLQVTAAKQAGDHAAAIVAMKGDASQKAAAFQALAAQFEEEKEKHVAAVANVMAIKETLNHVSEQYAKAASLATRRKAALGDVMKAVGVVIEKVSPLLDD